MRWVSAEIGYPIRAATSNDRTDAVTWVDGSKAERPRPPQTRIVVIIGGRSWRRNPTWKSGDGVKGGHSKA